MEKDLSSKNYTLEKHLKSLAEADKEYEVLYSIWELNKKNISSGLNMISSSFPNYSLHDISHSMNIIDNIQNFLGEDRISRLGATDTFLLLMAGLTHDIGMILTYKMLEDEWGNGDFIKKLEGYSHSQDRIISEAANLILQFKKKIKENKEDIIEGRAKSEKEDYKWALEIKNAVTLITAEVFRRKHAKQSSDDIKENSEIKNYAENFHSEQLPRRFMDLLANVAYLHGQGFENVMNRLYYKANGFQGDYIHPRFIACMIRLGDLLDFDSNRFNPYSNATIKEMPEISEAHRQKHASVTHMLISPSSIEAELNCLNEKVYREARNWFDWLEKEVEDQRREWTNIAPNDLGGLPPVITKNNIKILYNGIKAKPELLNLKFTMSQQKIFSILKGGGIYKEPGLVFIREIVQNALDASKIQMWKDLKSGLYDVYFKDPEIDLENLSFPDQINASIYKQYPISLSIQWKDEDKNILLVECVDRGTGISEAALLRMTQNVGVSYSNDNGYYELYKQMPSWVTPTAAFGIGLQSIFFVAESFEVETSYPGETTKKIVFRSSSDNQYSSIIQENINRKRGSTIRVEIQKNRFEELFGTTFNIEILAQVNIFEGDGDNMYLAKIDDFVRKTFVGITDFPFIYKSENPERSFHNEPKIKEINGDSKDNYKYIYYYQNGLLTFEIYEKKYGSKFTFCFSNRYEIDRIYKYLKLRNVPVKNASIRYYKTDYLGFSWNLYNQTSDQIVDLSRDNLTHEGRRWVTNTLLSDLLPEFVKLIKDAFLKELKIKQTEATDLGIQYLNYCLTARVFHIDDLNIDPLKRISIPREIASFNKKNLKASQLFDGKELYLIKGFNTNGHNVIISDDLNYIETNYSTKLSNKIVIWGNGYLDTMLMLNYICTEIVNYDDKCKIYKLEKSDKTDIKLVNLNVNLSYLCELENTGIHLCSRKTILALNNYQNIIVRNHNISGFDQFPDYTTCSIYSPFYEKEQINNLLSETKGKDKKDIYAFINSNLSNYITPFLLKAVKANNINKDVTDEKIYMDYTSLIYDFILAMRQKEEKK